ncbi:MAG TPA: DUF6036 family nucleotidyltransferase [Gammaproteobacteria bacterium]|nr:DUF6036 family nucleotidyltransferase [Gammaproteobacteria bacterium]
MNPDFRDILSIFNAEGVEYLIVGAYALAAHGIPRATGDIDLWIRRSPDNARRVWRALLKFGAPLSGLTENDLQTEKLVFQVGIAPRRIDILTSIDAVEFGAAWNNRIEITLDGLRLPVIHRSDLIINKRAVGRPQDIADVARLNITKQ